MIQLNSIVYGFLIYILLLFGYMTIFAITSLMFFSIFNSLRYKYRKYKFDDSYRPTFSVIIPAHNEEDVIERTINTFLKTSYPSNKKELIIVNDDSSDNTRNIAEKFAYKVKDALTGKYKCRKGNYENITLINRVKGGKGKSHVLNDGIRFSKNDILLIIDADVQLNSNIFELAAKHFSDKRVGAVAGYVSVSKKRGYILNNFVNFECTVAQKLLRLGFDTLGLHYIIPGGCGFFRKDIIDMIGKYDSDTLAEDTDMTWKLATLTKTKIHFDPSIEVVADEPTTLNSLWNQRVRWARGNFGVTRKHLHKVGNRMYGKTATLGYPFWVATIIVPLAFFVTTFGLLLNNILHVDVGGITILGRIMASTFFIIWIAGVVVNKGKSWFAGLISPGIPMLFIIITGIIYQNGIIDFMTMLKYAQYGTFINLILFAWISISIVLAYPTMILSKKHHKMAVFIQVFILGYWTILIISGLYGYFKELKRDELVWIRTIR